MKSQTIISFGVYDVTAKEDVTAHAENIQPFSDLVSVTQNNTKTAEYATLEPEQCALDGSLDIFPQSPENMGIWSVAQSDEKGSLASPFIVRFEFENMHTSSGLTIDTNAAEFRVRWETDKGIVAAQYKPDSEVFTFERTVENYTAIEFAFFSTNKPCRYLRFRDIKFGIGYEFKGEQVINCRIIEEIDILSAAISENICDFSFYDSKGRFNILNAVGAFPALQESQKVKVQSVSNGITNELGTFFLNGWENTSENILTCKAADTISRLTVIPFNGGMIDTSFGEFIRTAVPFECIVDSTIAHKTVKGYLPRSTVKEALQQAAFAVGAMVDCSRSDKIKIYPFSLTPTTYIKKSVKLLGGKVKAKEQYTRLDISVIKFSLGPGLPEEIFNDEIFGKITLEFEVPVYDLSIIGGEIIEQSVNHAVIQGQGEVLLTGKYYAKKTIKRSYPFPNKANVSEKVLSVENCTLLSMTNVDEIAANIIAYYVNQAEHTYSKIIGDEAVGSMVMTDAQSKVLKGFIERQEINVAGGMIVNASLVGNQLNVLANSAFTGEIYTSEGGIL